MEIYCNIDSDNRIYEFCLNNDDYYFTKKGYLDTNLISFKEFSDYPNYFILDNGVIKKQIDLNEIRNIAKAKCTDLFNSYVFALQDVSNEELYINSIILDEIYREVENGTSTPVTNLLATSLGVEDIHKFKLEKREEIEHFNYALTYLIAQKMQIFKFINECEDPNILENIEFNFSFATFSNMRLS